MSELRDIRDPLERARQATRLLQLYQQRGLELARLRKEAINEAAAATGMSLTAVASELGLSKARVTQIRKDAPEAARAIFGVGPLIVAIPTRASEDRPLGVVAAEDSLAATRLAEHLQALQFQVDQRQIPLDASWDPSPDTIAICGPKSSSAIARILRADPLLTFETEDTGRWVIADRLTEQRFASPTDDGEQDRDIAYVGRLAVKGGEILVIAGVHALGSLGAVDYLVKNMRELYALVGSRRFSCIIESRFEGSTPIGGELLCPPRLHQ